MPPIVHGFDPPERKWSAGTVYLRGQGAGQVRAVHGLDALPAEVSEMVTEAKLPEPGQQSSGSYEGDGYVILRHNYLPNSFSITLYREPLIDTRRDLLEELE